MEGFVLILWIGGQWFFGTADFPTKDQCDGMRYFYKVPGACMTRAELIKKIEAQEELEPE